jgi:hypothetical protein
LSLNTAGTDRFRPSATVPEVRNLSLAGDFCHGHIGLTTIESAVASGLNAVNAIVRRRGVGSEAEVLRPPTSPDSLYVLLRYLYAPYALGAKAYSEALEYLRGGPRHHRGHPASAAKPGRADEESLVRYLLTPGLPARHQRFDS